MADITIPIILILILTMTIPLILAVAILVGATQVAAMEVAVAAEINASLLKGEIISSDFTLFSRLSISYQNINT